MQCVNCGKEFDNNKIKGRKAKYCSKKCRNEYQAKMTPHEIICERCGKPFLSRSSKSKYCSRECAYESRKTGRTMYKKNCIYCGKEFETIHGNHKYCSSTCASRDYANRIRGEYFCEYCGKPRHSDHPNRNRFCSVSCARKAQFLKGETKQNQKLLRKLRWEAERYRICEYCGKEYVAKQQNQMYCSKECRYEGNKHMKRIQYAENYEGKEFVCAECGKYVNLQCGDKRSVYCSDECRMRAERRTDKEKRKAQMEKAFIEPVGIKETYYRYNGICAICGLPVPATTEPASAWAATRDHIVPLSKDGLHIKGNVQLAHRICNSMKYDTADEFTIDWSQKLIDEPGRWNDRLDELWEQIGSGAESITEVC